VSRRADPKLVGLKIGDEAVRLAIAAEGVVRCHSRALPAGAVRNGEVVDPGAVVEVVRRLLAACGARPRYAALVCAGRRTVCRAEALRSGEVAAAKAACADRMRRYLIFGSQPTTVSHCVQRGTALEGGDTWLLSAAAPVAQVEGHADVARRCGLTVLRVEPSTAALARVLRSGDEAVPPTLVVNAHCGACEIAAVRDDGLIYCQHLPLDIEALAGAATRAWSQCAPALRARGSAASGSTPRVSRACAAWRATGWMTPPSARPWPPPSLRRSTSPTASASVAS